MFEQILRIVLNYEGGFSDDPNDRGGKTNLGITEGTLNSAKQKGWIPQYVTIETLTTNHAKIIYRKGYWEPIHGDNLPEPLNLILFDAAVNHGVGGATQLLQESLNSLLPGTPLKVDGAFGPLTMKALQTILQYDKQITNTFSIEPHAFLRYLCVDILMNRVEKFDFIADKYFSQRKFYRGWIHQRVVNLAEKAGLED